MKRIQLALMTLVLAVCVSANALENGLSRTPPMGWNPWYSPIRTTYNESALRAIGDAMAANGLKAAGYNIIGFDACWQTGRDGNGVPVADPAKFPSGIPALAAYLHSKGLKLGVYFNSGTNGDFCYSNVGSYNYEETDALAAATWGADWLKFDLSFNSPISKQDSAIRMRNALKRATVLTGQQIIYATGDGTFGFWGAEIANTFRFATDLTGSWASVLSAIDEAAKYGRWTRPGFYLDMDFLQVNSASSTLTDTEAASQFAMWCMCASPLVLSFDPRTVSGTYLQMVTNVDLIAVDQDPAGVTARRIAYSVGTGGNLETWWRPLGYDGTSQAVALFNRSSSAASMSVYWTNILLQAGSASVRNLSTQTTLGTLTDSVSVSVPSHGCVVLKIVGPPMPPAIYVSDLPLRVATKDAALYGGKLAVDSVRYPKGISVLAPHSFTIDLTTVPGNPERFISDVGIDDAIASGGSVAFQVYADGTKIWDSGPLTSTSPQTTCNVDVRGRSSLTLTVTDGGVGSSNNRADWCDARLLVSRTGNIGILKR